MVKFRFDGQKESQIARLSYKQYENLKILPITVQCEIVEGAKHVISEEDTKLLNEKIRKVSSKGHINKLSEN